MYKEVNWCDVQIKYDTEKISEKILCKFFGISQARIHRAKKKGLFKTRNKEELKKILSEKSKNKKHTEKTKNKLSEIRKKYLLENPDKVPYLLNHSSKESYPEKYFTELFKNEGIDVVKKYRVGLYELDFCIIDKKIDIEIDGSQHYNDKKIVLSDRKRNEYLEKEGWDVIRINWSNYKSQSNEEKEKYIKNLKEYLDSLVDIKPSIKNIRRPKIKKIRKEIIKVYKNKHYTQNNKCVDCDSLITNYRKRCVFCVNKNYRKVKRPCALSHIF